MSGPDRAPREQKVIAGTFRKGREQAPQGEKVPEFDKVSALPRAPAYLNRHGREMWKTLGSQLVACGVLQTPDLYAFGMLCHTWQDFMAKATLGQPVKDSERVTLNMMFIQFGVNPAARRRVARYLTEQPKPKQSENRFAKHATDA